LIILVVINTKKRTILLELIRAAYWRSLEAPISQLPASPAALPVVTSPKDPKTQTAPTVRLFRSNAILLEASEILLNEVYSAEDEAPAPSAGSS
jgi:hypothetical protein